MLDYLNGLKRLEALDSKVLEKHRRFYSWIELSPFDKLNERLNREKEILDRIGKDKILSHDFLKTWLKVIQENTAICSLLEFYQMMYSPSRFEFRDIFNSHKCFSMELLHKTGVEEYLLEVLKQDSLRLELQKGLSSKLKDQYSRVRALKQEAEPNRFRDNVFLVKESTLNTFDLTQNDLIEALKTCKYNFKLNAEEQNQYTFEFEKGIANLPLLKIHKIPLTQDNYTVFENLGNIEKSTKYHID